MNFLGSCHVLASVAGIYTRRARARMATRIYAHARNYTEREDLGRDAGASSTI